MFTPVDPAGPPFLYLSQPRQPQQRLQPR